MTVKSLLIAFALVVAPQLHASNLFPLTKKSLTINQCPISITNNSLDLALLNQGYFVVSHGKKDSELIFTRWGAMVLDRNSYIRTSDGDYLLAVTKKSDVRNLNKIKIPTKNLAPKATSKINIGLNFPSMATEDEEYTTSVMIYDSLSNAHTVTIKSAKIDMERWGIKVFVDDVERDEGFLVFNTVGVLSKQEGLSHIQWPAEYGMHQLKIDFKSSTQFGSPYSMQFQNMDGYPLGRIVGMDITRDGEIYLMYSNGQSKKLKNRIAVALFTNPKYLERVTDHLYRPSAKSGQPMIHWVNSDYAMINGALEDETCLKM